MIVVDSCGWIEVFGDGPLADSFAPYLRDLRSVVTPTIVVYEVYRKLKQTTSEDEALSAITVLNRTKIIELSAEIALTGADLAIQYRLSMADALVLATGYLEDADVVTSDRSFKDLPRVVYFHRGPDRLRPAPLRLHQHPRDARQILGMIGQLRIGGQ